MLITTLKSSIFLHLPYLQVLNLSHSPIQQIEGTGFNYMPNVQVLDLTMCPLTSLPGEGFRTMSELKSVYTGDFRLCCAKVLPEDFNINSCSSPAALISSCSSLIGSHFLKYSLLTLGIMGFFFNIVTVLLPISKSCHLKINNKTNNHISDLEGKFNKKLLQN